MHQLANLILSLSLTLFVISCDTSEPKVDAPLVYKASNILDYRGKPSAAKDRNALAFSDQGAWFAYSFPIEPSSYGGFVGPYLMTQENGVWSSKVLSHLELISRETNQSMDWSDFQVSQTSYNSHLKQVFKKEQLEISQTLVYATPHSALITSQITNLSKETITFQPTWRGHTFLEGLEFKDKENGVIITSDKSNAIGIIQVFGDKVIAVNQSDSSYSISVEKFEIKAGESKQLIITHSFVFPEYSQEKEQSYLEELVKNPQDLLQNRKREKETQLGQLCSKLDTTWNDTIYKNLLAKSVLTLQNNWRIPSGEIKHHGLFPSYHYKWFNGFWAWDSWKHAVALAHYDTFLAQEQIKAMYDFQTKEGFIPDCVFRDTSIENHNYRNTKPPLSAWAVWKVYEQSHDLDFLKELYPKIVEQHKWWYTNRDHDQDGICEYGSTDGSLIAAKWESGMDNAVRFDSSTIVKNSAMAYSLDQESVDLNAYLYAEKKYLADMSKVLNKMEKANLFDQEAQRLKKQIQVQFYDSVTGWFYDTSLDGKTFVKVMGSEAWIPLWAEIATKEQAERVKDKMMNPDYFNTKVPFPTLSANHPNYKPNGGYWRGPVWLDQSYFGVKGLHNYGYDQEAYEASYQLMHNAEGVLKLGKPIRENYDPSTGEGLESQNFSWSAACYLLLLLKE